MKQLKTSGKVKKTSVEKNEKRKKRKVKKYEKKKVAEKILHQLFSIRSVNFNNLSMMYLSIVRTVKPN